MIYVNAIIYVFTQIMSFSFAPIAWVSSLALVDFPIAAE